MFPPSTLFMNLLLLLLLLLF